MVQSEERQNERLLALSNEILDLTKTIHEMTFGGHASCLGRGPRSVGGLKPTGLRFGDPPE